MPPGEVDYDAEYRALDLPPGAALRELEDRARLIRTAFEPAGLPGALGVLAGERVQAIDRAAETLSRYWKTHGKAPPSGRIRRLQALPGGQSEHPAEAGSHRREVIGLGAALAEALVREVPAPPSPLTGAGELAPGSATRPAATERIAPASETLARTDDQHETSLSTRPFRFAASLLFKAAMVGLVVAAAVRVQQYRADHPWIATPGEPNSAIATAMPNARPVQWSGTAANRQVFGAAAPAISGHQRAN